MGSIVFPPGVAARKALGLLNKLGYCLARQTTAMSLALTGLLADVDSIRHAILQIRAAIIFFAFSTRTWM